MKQPLPSLVRWGWEGRSGMRGLAVKEKGLALSWVSFGQVCGRWIIRDSWGRIVYIMSGLKGHVHRYIVASV